MVVTKRPATPIAIVAASTSSPGSAMSGEGLAIGSLRRESQ
jgi:hypothetical protein